MQQDYSYPDPAQLRVFSKEPVPFHELKPRDLELLDSGDIRYGVGGVEYRWSPEYITVESGLEEWEPADDVDADITHSKAWGLSQSTTFDEDHVTVTAMFVPEDRTLWLAKAVWVLDSITINRRE